MLLMQMARRGSIVGGTMETQEDLEELHKGEEVRWRQKGKDPPAKVWE